VLSSLAVLAVMAGFQRHGLDRTCICTQMLFGACVAIALPMIPALILTVGATVLVIVTTYGISFLAGTHRWGSEGALGKRFPAQITQAIGTTAAVLFWYSAGRDLVQASTSIQLLQDRVSSYWWLRAAGIAIPFAWMTAIYFSPSRKWKPYLLHALKPEDIYPQTLDDFTVRTQELEHLGFRFLGDYLLQETPDRIISRFLINREQSVVVSIHEYRDQVSTEFRSVFSNGACLLSAYPLPNIFDRLRKLEFNPHDILMFNTLPESMPVADALSYHVELAGEYALQRGCPIVVQPADQLKEVVQYVHQLVFWLLYEQGLLHKRPFPEKPTWPCTKTVPVTAKTQCGSPLLADSGENPFRDGASEILYADSGS